MALTDETKKKPTEDVVDINLDGIQRTRFRINGDSSAIIELNLSDLGIMERLEKGLSQLDGDMEDIAKLDSEDSTFTEKLKEIDKKMRDTIDFIFDYPVSAVCARYGTMYDPLDGKFRYERIIEGLVKLYESNITDEYKKLQDRIKKHTSKYTSSSKKRK